MLTPRIRQLGEVALRVSDLDNSQRFYAEVIGLELLRRFEHAAFFKIAEGLAGHTQVLALFDRAAEPGYSGVSAARTTLDHFALSIPLADFEPELARLRQAGLAVETTEHAWVRWRSLYVADPDGNTVELVCFDPEVK